MTPKTGGGPNTQSDERGRRVQNNEGHQGGQNGGSKKEGPPNRKPTANPVATDPEPDRRTSAYSPSEPGEPTKSTARPQR